MTYAYTKNKRYPIQYKDNGVKCEIAFSPQIPEFQLIKRQVKGLEGSKFVPGKKVWAAKSPHVSLRNAFVLGRLTRGEVGMPFEQVIAPYREVITKNIDYRFPLYDHQKDMLNLALDKRYVYFAAEMGLGKTLAAYELAHQIKALTPDQFWVVAPKAPLQAWKSERNHWNIDDIHPKLIVNSIESITKAIETANDSGWGPPKLLIIDEAAAFKTATSQRSQRMKDLSHTMLKEDSYIVAMSGTPAPKDPADLHHQYELLWPGLIAEGNRNQLVQSLAYTEKQTNPMTGKPFNKVTGWNTDKVNRLSNILKPVTITLYKKDCISLPDKIYQTITLDIEPSVLSAAKMIAEAATNQLTALQAVRQLSDGFQYHQEGDTTVRIKSPKMEWVKSFLKEQFSGNRIVIYGAYKESIRLLVEEISSLPNWTTIKLDGTGAACSDPKIIPTQDSFQDTDKYPQNIAWIANPASASQGLTLTKADTMIYYSNTFKAEDRMQSEDRIHRISQKNNANIIDLIHLPTDQLILDRIKNKVDLQKVALGEIVDALTKARLGAFS